MMKIIIGRYLAGETREKSEIEINWPPRICVGVSFNEMTVCVCVYAMKLDAGSGP